MLIVCLLLMLAGGRGKEGGRGRRLREGGRGKGVEGGIWWWRRLGLGGS